MIRLLAEQSNGLLDEDDFKPLPCGDPNCCSFTFVARKPKGELMPLTRLVSYEDHVDQLADRMNFNLTDALEVLWCPWRVEDYFRVVVKPFMDCVHVRSGAHRRVLHSRYSTRWRQLCLSANSIRFIAKERRKTGLSTSARGAELANDARQ